jgi:hypothetical protein
MALPFDALCFFKSCWMSSATSCPICVCSFPRDFSVASIARDFIHLYLYLRVLFLFLWTRRCLYVMYAFKISWCYFNALFGLLACIFSFICLYFSYVYYFICVVMIDDVP